MTRSPRAVGLLVLRYGVALAALAWAVAQVEVRTVLDLVTGLDASATAVVLVATGVGLAGRFFTWQATLWPVQRVGLRAAAAVDLSVNFINQLLPSRLSGRVAAPFVLRQLTGVSYADAAAVAGVHTGLYAVLYGLTALAGLGLAAGTGRLGPGLTLLLALSTGLYLVAGAAVLLAGTTLRLLNPVVAGAAGLVGRVPRVGPSLASRVEELTGVTEASTTTFRRLTTAPGVWLPYAGGWALALVVAPGVRVAVLFAGLGTPFDPVFALPLYLVVAYSVTLLPLTPGGIGVTEATATAVFVALGAPAEAVVPTVLADRTLGVYLPALAGWYPTATLDR